MSLLALLISVTWKSHNQQFFCYRSRMFGNRNALFLIIGALIVVVGVLGYNLYQDRKQPEGLQI
jgi:predicted negative regulator of RcsB-dependent stress response